MPVRSVDHQSRLGNYALALFRDWRVRHILRRSLQALSAGECDRILRETGLGAADLNVCLHTVFGSEDLLSRLMTAIGLDPDRIRAASPETMRDLERTCMTCPIKRRCRKSLGRDEAAASYDDFCPNAPLLRHLVSGSIAADIAARPAVSQLP